MSYYQEEAWSRAYWDEHMQILTVGHINRIPSGAHCRFMDSPSILMTMACA
ncbi:MAG: hypothetical protein U0694_05965 [Anaerolineae bacterium]